MAWPGDPMNAPTDETMITRPRWRRTILARARLVTRNTPERLVSITSAHASSLIRRTRVSRVIPALATRTSTGPQVSSMVANAALTWPGRSRRRPARGNARCRSGVRRSRADREVTATRSPWLRNHCAQARPMPRDPPVTSTTRPARRRSQALLAHDVLAGGPDPGHRLSLDHPLPADGQPPHQDAVKGGADIGEPDRSHPVAHRQQRAGLGTLPAPGCGGGFGQRRALQGGQVDVGLEHARGRAHDRPVRTCTGAPPGGRGPTPSTRRFRPPCPSACRDQRARRPPPRARRGWSAGPCR